MKVPSGRRSTRRVPALRPSTRLISMRPSLRMRSLIGPRSASARNAVRTRRPSTSATDAPAGCCWARRRIPLARSASSTGGGLEPPHHALEIAKRVVAAEAVLAIHEIQPQSLSDEHEGRAFAVCARREGRNRRGVGCLSECEHRWHRGTTSISLDATGSKRGMPSFAARSRVVCALTDLDDVAYIFRASPAICELIDTYSS
jgi:hypothetical protein